MKKSRLPQYLSQLALFFFLSFFVGFSSYADSTHPNVIIKISETGNNRFSVSTKNAPITDILQKISELAGFKLKLLHQTDVTTYDWNISSLRLLPMLKVLLKEYSTVMIFEAPTNQASESDALKLTELWLVAPKDGSSRSAQQNGSISVQVSPSPQSHQTLDNLSSERRTNITYIDNLEGLTGKDIITRLHSILETESDPVVRSRAVKALTEVGGESLLDSLEYALGDESDVVRIELAKSYAGIQHQRSLLALGQLLIGDRSSKVRLEAIRSLAQQENAVARTFIESVQNDKDSSVAQFSQEVLSKWKSQE